MPAYKLLDLKQNRNFVTRLNCLQSWAKKLDLEYFHDSEAVYNGLMVRFHEGRALTVRDRPPNVFRVE